jgi:hypothetical protein
MSDHAEDPVATFWRNFPESDRKTASWLARFGEAF